MGAKTVGAKFRRIAILLGALAIVSAGSGIVALSLLNGNTTQLSITTDRRENILVPAEEALAEIRLTVVQLQQYLSDVSATRGLNGLDDGFQKAEAQAKEFFRDVQTLHTAANSDPELKAAIGQDLAALTQAFSQFHDMGERMAKAYVAGGPEAGNAMMGEFDAKADTFAAAVTKVEKAVHSIGDQAHDDQITALNSMAAAAKWWRMAMFVMAAFTIAVVLGALIFSGKISKRLAAVVADINSVSLGKEANIEVGTDDDDIAELNRALLRFMEAERRKKELEREEERRFATERTRQRLIQTAAEKFDGIVVGLLSRIKNEVQHLHSSADSLTANAEKTQQLSAAVAAATDQATANVETVSAAGIEISASIQEISRQVHSSTTIAQAATEEVHQATTKISSLAAAAHKIGEVISLIGAIAAQTNMLALNATIESARAGESGKGFAVVANEVKNLSGQTRVATDDIAAQINAVQNETKFTVEAIDGIAATVAQIDELSTAIAGAVEEQGAATTEIARNIEQASQGTREIANSISTVAHAASETGRMAQTVFQAANGLLDDSNTLENEIQTFLTEMRAL